MTTNTTTPAIVLTEAATKIIRADVAADKRDRMRHAEYVAEMGVMLDDVAAHVALFREAYKKANKSATGDDVKAYATKVRNGLNRALGKVKGEASEPTALVTTLGTSSPLADVIAAWEAAQK